MRQRKANRGKRSKIKILELQTMGVWKNSLEERQLPSSVEVRNREVTSSSSSSSSCDDDSWSDAVPGGATGIGTSRSSGLTVVIITVV
ncbi:hypothetical protein AAES_91555 [Amazona aestiva]|uniref:Uncharacterized protein n=1 Tax=Amazona aestiva TaxID=12930 RepID=A0A0Q3TJ50_AMAAE|nr:hypothetical protein AAES_91555 [Amazona aestiva]